MPAMRAESLGSAGALLLAVGGVLGFRLGGEYRGENLGDAPSRKKAERRSGSGCWMARDRSPR